MAEELFTIGYSGYPDINEFLETLKSYGIQVVIDVRSVPLASAYFENYNKDRLSHKLKDHGIYYLNYTRQFGARQSDPVYYRQMKANESPRLDFEIFSKSPQFLDGVQRVEKSKAKIVFMCAEKKPSVCHRSILVSRAFHDRGHEVIHIEPNGIASTQADIERELLDEYFKDRQQLSLFTSDNRTKEELIAEAYRKRNMEIGFKLEDLQK